MVRKKTAKREKNLKSTFQGNDQIGPGGRRSCQGTHRDAKNGTSRFFGGPLLAKGLKIVKFPRRKIGTLQAKRLNIKTKEKKLNYFYNINYNIN
jgi:hypothetical protein